MAQHQYDDAGRCMNCGFDSTTLQATDISPPCETTAYEIAQARIQALDKLADGFLALHH